MASFLDLLIFGLFFEISKLGLNKKTCVNNMFSVFSRFFLQSKYIAMLLYVWKTCLFNPEHSSLF